MGFNLGRLGIGLSTLGLSELAGEDTMSRIPVLGSLGGYESDEQKALIAKQKQLADDAKKRRLQQEQAGMNALGQQMLAFNPQNQMMAQMFGPEAAFTPQQFAQMAADPGAMSQADVSRAHAESLRTGKPMQGVTQQDLDRMRRDQERQQMIRQNMQAPGPGPAPLQSRTPQAGRRY